jgi:hypothetical protein
MRRPEAVLSWTVGLWDKSGKLLGSVRMGTLDRTAIAW